MYRDNTKDYTPRLYAPSGGRCPSLRSMARPGSRNHNVPKAAGSVSSVNGQTPRPGYKQKRVPGGGVGSIARPGFHQKIRG